MTSRRIVLFDPGDLNAPLGSRPWAIAVRLRLQAAIKRTESDWKHLQELLRAMAEHAGYRQLEDQHGRPFTSYHAFCTAPEPYGLGYDPEALERLWQERRDAQALAKEMEGKTINAGDGPLTKSEKANLSIVKVSSDTKPGNSAAYLTARIARDHPDILQRMQAGEYRSVRAAAKAAGIVKDKTPLQSVQAAWRKADAEERQRIVQWLLGQIDDHPEGPHP